MMNANFFDHFKQQAQALEQNSTFENDIPRLKAPILKINRENPQVYLRVLPTLEMLKGTTLDFGQGYRTMMWQEDGKWKNLRLPLQQGDTPLERDIAYWQDLPNSFLTGKYGVSSPSSKYTILVCKVVENNGVWSEELDTDGTPKVYQVELPVSAFSGIADLLSSSLNCPKYIDAQGNESLAPLSILSLEASFMVGVTKAKPGATSWGVNCYSNVPLGNLVGKVETKLEDLTQLNYNLDDVAPNIVNAIRKKHGTVNPHLLGEDAPQAPAQQQQYAQPQQPMTPQAPVQPATPPAQPQAPVQPATPQQPVQPATPPVQQPQAPIQPQAPVAPQQPATPPVQPQAPVTPPAQPVTPPVQPQAPVQPATPQQPETPSQPMNQQGILNDLKSTLGM